MDNVKVVYSPDHGYIRDLTTVLYYSTFTDSISEYYKMKNMGEIEPRVEKSYRRLYKYIHANHNHLRVFFMKIPSQDRFNINHLISAFFNEQEIQIGDIINYINRYSSYYLFYFILDNMDHYNHFTPQFYDHLLENEVLMQKYIYGLHLSQDAKEAIIDLYRHREHIAEELTVLLKEVHKRMMIEFDHYLKPYRGLIEQDVRERIGDDAKKLLDNKRWKSKGFSSIERYIISSSVFNIYTMTYIQNSRVCSICIGYIYDKFTSKKIESANDWYHTLMPFGDPLRCEILKLLYYNPKIGVSELARRLNRSPNNIEYQIGIFKKEGYLRKNWGECELDKAAVNLAAYRMERFGREVQLKQQEEEKRYERNA